TDPAPGHLELSGTEPELVIAADPAKATLPQGDFTVEWWVRVDEPAPAGAIVSVLSADGDAPRGWQIGYRDRKFAFTLAPDGARSVSEVQATTPFELRRWYHVAATRAGSDQRLYVNGELSGVATVSAAPIAYDPGAAFEIGVLRRESGPIRMRGALCEFRLFQRAMDPGEIRSRAAARLAEFPEPGPAPEFLRLAYGPFADWRDRQSVVITWETEEAVPTHLEVEAHPASAVTPSSSGPTRRHEAVVTGLDRDREYHYRIRVPEVSGKPSRSRRYALDTSFHYALPSLAATSPGSESDPAFRTAARILKDTGITDGYCLVLGATEGRLAEALARQSRLQVVVVDPRQERIEAIRRRLASAGVYGVRVTAQHVPEGALPFGDLMANLIVSESALETGTPPPFPSTEVHRVLRPEGGVVFLGSDTASDPGKWTAWRSGGPLADATTGPDSGWMQWRRGRLEGAGEWSHQYGSPDNTSTSLDERVSGNLQVAWWGDPGPRPMPDRGNRNPAPLSVGGRLFIQGNRILFGLDAYNGTILWTLFAPEVRRANVTRDCSNMAAAGDRLYVVHGRWCLALDGATGERRRRFAAEGDGTTAGFDWGYVAAVGGQLIGSRQKRDAAYLGDDGEWYEDFDTQQTSRVTSDRIFAVDPESGARRWTYEGGVVLNSTLTIADGMILFLESRSPEARAAAGSRVPHEHLTDQHLVALDLATGRPLWEKSHDFSSCQYMTYLVYSQGTAVVTGTDKDKHFHTFAFAAPAPGRPGGDDLEKAIPGRLLWSDSHKEDKGHHSGHLQHPLVVDQVFYSDQRAFDLRSGKLLRTDLPERRGCGVMSASRHAVFFRHHFQGMWDLASNQRTQFQGIRTGCWLGLIPAGGLLLAPESSAGCSCTHAIQTSIAYLPKSKATP
ncbi:MAG: PQQ-binding-like beta-propeller repeat protein, partial [Verrucomicrobia bacterium]|nr:PQQ-binding-like beta-propeller repeat protein [Verrucomicrobiota bacterium]